MATIDERVSALLGGLDYPMFVVTTAADGQMAGCFVGFTTQISITPLRFLVGLSKKNHTLRVALRATHLAVHFLDRENLHLAHLFGEQTGDEVNKFEACSWSMDRHGVPVLDGVAAWFIGEIVERVDLGDHLGHVLQPVGVSVDRPITGMLSFAAVRDFDPGHEA